MTGMFSGCSSLKTIPYFDISSSQTVSLIFDNCSSLDIDPNLLIKHYKITAEDIEDWFNDNNIMQEKYPEYFL
jgi:hypothetical protein